MLGDNTHWWQVKSNLSICVCAGASVYCFVSVLFLGHTAKVFWSFPALMTPLVTPLPPPLPPPLPRDACATLPTFSAMVVCYKTRGRSRCEPRFLVFWAKWHICKIVEDATDHLWPLLTKSFIVLPTGSYCASGGFLKQPSAVLGVLRRPGRGCAPCTSWVSRHILKSFAQAANPILHKP